MLIQFVPSRHSTSTLAATRPVLLPEPGVGSCLGPVPALAHRRHPRAFEAPDSSTVRSTSTIARARKPWKFYKVPAAQDKGGFATLESAKTYVGLDSYAALPGAKGANSAIRSPQRKNDSFKTAPILIWNPLTTALKHYGSSRTISTCQR